MYNQRAVGMISLVVAIVVLLFGDNLYNQYLSNQNNYTAHQPRSYENQNLVKYNHLIEEADNEIRKSYPDYNMAITLYEKALEIANSDSEVLNKKAIQGVKRCEIEIIRENKMSQRVANLEKRKAIITFRRIKRFTGSAISLDIYVDSKIVGSLDNDDEFIFESTPRSIIVKIKPPALSFARTIDNIRIDLEPSARYTFTLEADSQGGGFKYDISKDN